MADIEVGGDLGQLLDHLVGRADDHIAALDDVLHLGCRPRLLPCVEAGNAADLALDAGALRRFGDGSRGHRPPRTDAQAAPVEILAPLAIQLPRLVAALAHPDKLPEASRL